VDKGRMEVVGSVEVVGEPVIKLNASHPRLEMHLNAHSAVYNSQDTEAP